MAVSVPVYSTKEEELAAGDDKSSIASSAAAVATAKKESETFQIEEDGEDESRLWNNKLDFLMSCISYAVGLGNIWRFPYKCYKNGGGAFLIPYFISWFLVGVPLFFFETSLGQQFRKGPVGVWDAIPIFKGVGMATIMISFLVSIQYAVVIAWALAYLFSSFAAILPWRNCDHYWNTANCINETIVMELTRNRSASEVTANDEFWKIRVLGESSTIDHPGHMMWILVGTLTLSWIMVYAIIYKGLHSSGKIVWFTALFPYVLIFTLLGYVCTLPGVEYGLKYYITPNMDKLTSATAWVDAATQVMYSYGIGFGSLITLGCYNRYHHNNQRDAMVIGVINSGTSLLAGVAVFGALGFEATKQGKLISEVAEQGPGLIFQAYPQIFLEMPLSQFWSCLFFIMVAVLGVDSEFCMVEAVMAGLEDQWPGLFKAHKKKLTLLACVIMYLMAWPMLDQGGVYLFQQADSMCASGPALLWTVFWEVVAISWFFGIKRFYYGLKHMIGHKTPIHITIYWWAFCWCCAAPAVCVVSSIAVKGVFLYSLIYYEPVKYGNYEYPQWAEIMGWLFSMASMVLTPGYMIFYLITTPGTFMERVKSGLTAKILPRAEKQWVRDQLKRELAFADSNSSSTSLNKATTADPPADNKKY